MKQSERRPSGLWLVLLGSVMASGCGGGKGTVRGVVTCQGKPVPVGSVAFFGPNNKVVNAALDDQGRYTATDVPVGIARITVTTPPPTRPMPPGKRAKSVKKIPIPEDAVKHVELISIPVRYSDPDQSGLTCSVTSGAEVTYDIELK